MPCIVIRSIDWRSRFSGLGEIGSFDALLIVFFGGFVIFGLNEGGGIQAEVTLPEIPN